MFLKKNREAKEKKRAIPYHKISVGNNSTDQRKIVKRQATKISNASTFLGRKCLGPRLQMATIIPDFQLMAFAVLPLDGGVMGFFSIKSNLFREKIFFPFCTSCTNLCTNFFNAVDSQ